MGISRNRLEFLAVSILTILVIGLSSSMLASVKGQPVGLVCLAPASATACPASPVTVSATVGTQLSLVVLVQGADAISGFDITLKANHTIIKPADASVSGNLLFGGSIVLKCIGGVLKTGSLCPSTDNPDTIHVLMVGPPGFLTISPVTGLLFTAVYNVTGTSTTPISFQVGCSPSSVIGTSTCVLFSNGSLSNPMVTIQGASYTQAPIPTFTIGVSTVQSLIALTKGESGNSTIMLSSINGFSGTVSLSLVITPTVRHPPLISLSSNSVTLASGGFGTALLTALAQSNTDKAAYVITVTGTAGSQNGSVLIQLIVTSR